MKPNNKQQIIPETIFAEAAAKLFKCTFEDIDIRMIDENKEAFVIYQSHGYKVSTRQVLREDIEFQLTDNGAANHIHFGCWVEATKHSVQISKILNKLIKTINDVEEAKMLLIAISLGSYSQDADVAFWEILSRIDNTGELLGNAMVITAKVYNGGGLIDDLMDLQILNGITAYNMQKSGIFETVYVGDDDSQYPEFYIYSAEHDFK